MQSTTRKYHLSGEGLMNPIFRQSIGESIDVFMSINRNLQCTNFLTTGTVINEPFDVLSPVFQFSFSA